MSLRFRLICLIAIVLIASLVVEGTIVSFNASRSVQTEMNSALQVGQQIVKNALAQLPVSHDRRRYLEALVAAFKGNQHLRVSLSGGAAATVGPSLEGSHFGTVPSWFVRFLGITPVAAWVPIAIAGQDYGSIVIETAPNNEILEVWNDLGDGLTVLTLFFGVNILLIYVFIGRALRPLDHLAGALEQIGHGDYKLRISGNSVPELSRLQGSFNRMASELAEMDEEKRRLNEQLLTLQEEERSEIARDLHDEISPFLFAVNVDLATISRLANQGQSAEIAGEIRSTLEAVSHMQRQIRTMLGRLRPGVLADFGLAAEALAQDRAAGGRRGSRVVLLVHRQETMQLLGFPLVRYIDIHDPEKVLRAIHTTDPNVLCMRLAAWCSPQSRSPARSAITRRRSRCSCRITRCRGAR
jgi:two-component system, NarL family, sensor histidine kinase UhpB